MRDDINEAHAEVVESLRRFDRPSAPSASALAQACRRRARLLRWLAAREDERADLFWHMDDREEQ